MATVVSAEATVPDPREKRASCTRPCLRPHAQSWPCASKAVELCNGRPLSQPYTVSLGERGASRIRAAAELPGPPRAVAMSKKSKMTSTLKSNAEANALTVKWGAFEVKGLDPKRAEAIGLQPVVKN